MMSLGSGMSWAAVSLINSTRIPALLLGVVKVEGGGLWWSVVGEWFWFFIYFFISPLFNQVG
jgi:hypothetical protein